MSKLTDDDVRAIRAAEGSQTALARTYGVSPATISRIKRGLARQNVEDDMSDATQPPVEGGVIDTLPPAEPELARTDVEDDISDATQPPVEGGVIDPSPPAEPEAAPGGAEKRIEGTSERPVHLGDGRVLAMGDTAIVAADIAKILIGNGQAKAA